MPAFDADAYRAAREPFTFTTSGRTYTARLVSAELVVTLERAFTSDDVAERTRATRRLLRAAFPWRVSMLWLGDPVQRFMALDVSSRNEGLRRFFRFQGGATVAPPAMNGTP